MRTRGPFQYNTVGLRGALCVPIYRTNALTFRHYWHIDPHESGRVMWERGYGWAS